MKQTLDTRPIFRILDPESMKRIIARAYDLLQTPGFFLHDATGLEILAASGAQVDFDKKKVQLSPPIIDKALSTVPSCVTLYDQSRQQRKLPLEGSETLFGPSGSAIYVQDFENETVRRRPEPGILPNIIISWNIATTWIFREDRLFAAMCRKKSPTLIDCSCACSLPENRPSRRVFPPKVTNT